MSAMSVRILRSRWLPVLAAAVCAGLIPMGLPSAASAPRFTASHRAAARAHGRARWVKAWAASPQVATPGSTAATGFNNQTVRNIVFSSVGGNLIRVRFTNTFGNVPLQIGAASIAVAGTGAGTSGPAVPLSFGGQSSMQIPIGAEALSDPVRLRVPALHDLAVSVFLPQASGPATQHAIAQQVNYVASGNQTLDTGGTPFTTQTRSWYFVDAVDVVARRNDLGTVVALGDSITDGAHFEGQCQRPVAQ